MSYKPSLEKFFSIRNSKLAEGQDCVLLAQEDGKYYRVKEYIGLLEKIEPRILGIENIPTVLVKFAGGKTFRIRAYIDTNLEVGCFVSVYGIFTKDAFENLQFTCKGGMVRAFGRLTEAGRVNTKYIYRFGFGELSQISESFRYPSTLSNIEVLEQGMLWTYYGTDIEEIEAKKAEDFIEEDTTLDFSTGDQFSINESNGEVTNMTS